MKFTTPLNKNHEFRRLYKKGKSAGSSYVIVYCSRNNSPYNKLGITVSKKVGGAVERNRVRRRLKEIYRLNELNILIGYNIVIVARVKSQIAQYSELEASVISLFKKLRIFAGTQTESHSK